MSPRSKVSQSRDLKANRLGLSSPRLRRRLAWTAVGVGALAAIVVAFLFIPDPKQPNQLATGKPGSASVAPPVKVKVRPADRRAIDQVLDRFIPDGVGRRSMSTAWKLSGPELKSASTLEQWKHDATPIPYYPVGEKTFHDWETLDAGRNYVDFSILVFPRRRSHLGAWGFSGEMVRRGTHWLVNRFYTAATFNQAGKETGPLVRAAEGDGGLAPGPSRLAPEWLILPIVGTFGAALLLLLTFLLVTAHRDRGMRRRNATETLPPLPAAALRRWSGVDERL